MRQDDTRGMSHRDSIKFTCAVASADALLFILSRNAFQCFYSFFVIYAQEFVTFNILLTFVDTKHFSYQNFAFH